MPLSPRTAPPRRVLVTGVAGFIGAALARDLLARGHAVTGLDDFSSGWRERLPLELGLDFEEADVGASGVLAQRLRTGNYDVVVHLAARVGVRAVLEDPEGCCASNLAGARALAGALAELPAARRPRVLAASSSEVYAEKRAPLREGDPLRSSAGRGRWAYAASKRRGEELLDAAGPWRAGGAPLHLRFFNVVGPGQDSDSGMVLPTFVERALAGEALPLHGDGSQVRTFAHVDEVSAALVHLAEAEATRGGALNVGGRARTSIAALAHLVTRRAGRGVVLSTDPRLACGASFEDVLFREPDLGRLAATGAPLPGRDLEEIVADCLTHHTERARPRRARARRDASCVSPAS